MASVGLADPAIYKNKPILNRPTEHYNVSVLTLVTARELQICRSLVASVKGSRSSTAAFGCYWDMRGGTAVEEQKRELRATGCPQLLHKRVPANCSSGTAGCGACHILRHVRNVMMGQIVLRAAHRGRVQSSTGDLILYSDSNHLTHRVAY